MALEFDSIPDANPDPSAAGAGKPTETLQELSVKPSRRSVLRAVTFAAVGLGAAALTLSWSTQTRRALAETGRSGLLGFDDPHCRDAYPNGYGERYDSGGAYTSRNGYAAACTGGAYISNSYCLFGWHRYPRSDRCGPSGNKRKYFTVCRARVA